MKYDVILTAAGSGARSNLTYNKIFLPIHGKPCFMHSVDLFLADNEMGHLYIAIQPKDEDQFLAILKEHAVDLHRVSLIYGGKTRQQSVFAALKKVKAQKVFVHDSARPFVQMDKIKALKKALAFEKAAILAIPATDTLKEVDAFKEINKTINRDKIYYAQTPQGFETDLLYKAHELAEEEHFMATDDAQVIEYHGKSRVQVVMGDKYNLKITTPDDVLISELYYQFIMREQ